MSVNQLKKEATEVEVDLEPKFTLNGLSHKTFEDTLESIGKTCKIKLVFLLNF